MKLVILLLGIFLLLICNAKAADTTEETTPTVKDKSACVLPPEVGPCRSSKTRYYHHNESKTCKEFFYGGCMGNANNFETLEECKKLCVET